MVAMGTMLSMVHLLGMALAVGAATVKVTLVLKARSDPDFVPAFLVVRRPVTRFIVAGLVLATLSGVAWLVQGYPWSPRLVLKVAFVVGMWIIGPVIDKVVEPPLERLAPEPGGVPTEAFLQAQNRHLAFELLATLAMYAAFVLGATL